MIATLPIANDIRSNAKFQGHGTLRQSTLQPGIAKRSGQTSIRQCHDIRMGNFKPFSRNREKRHKAQRVHDGRLSPGRARIRPSPRPAGGGLPCERRTRMGRPPFDLGARPDRPLTAETRPVDPAQVRGAIHRSLVSQQAWEGWTHPRGTPALTPTSSVIPRLVRGTSPNRSTSVTRSPRMSASRSPGDDGGCCMPESRADQLSPRRRRAPTARHPPASASKKCLRQSET